MEIQYFRNTVVEVYLPLYGLCSLNISLFKFIFHYVPARTLDADLAGLVRAAQTTFDWERIPFVLEAWVSNTRENKGPYHFSSICRNRAKVI